VKTLQIVFLAPLLIPLLMTACHKNESQAEGSLSALASLQTVESYGYPYWNDQFQRKTDLWQEGADLLQSTGSQVLHNCQPVLAVVAPRIPFSTHAEHPLGIPGFGPTAEPEATH
jgi:hypothetical protein